MSKVLSAVNAAGYGLRKATDYLVGDDNRDIRGMIPTLGAAFVAGTKNHRVPTTKAKKSRPTFEDRVQRYIAEIEAAKK